MQRFYLLLFLSAFSCAASAGCGGASKANEPMTEQQLQQQMQKVQDEERVHFQQLQTQVQTSLPVRGE